MSRVGLVPFSTTLYYISSWLLLRTSSRLSILTNNLGASSCSLFFFPGSSCRCLCRSLSGGGLHKLQTMAQPQDVVVRDPEALEKKITAVREAGPIKLQVIADFDGTLTKYWIDGRRGQSSHSLLQQGNPEYDAKRMELFEYYHPIEFSPTIPIEEKTKIMEEWWEKAHGLLIEGGLTLDAIKQSVSCSTIGFRDGVIEFLEFLQVNTLSTPFLKAFDK
ncbi:hypothetical protein HPP92_026626 [Vanilla planifolia]|uniref:5'-nucleotidase n=1 Tax=Vanilla planifolia TaxID=51239 RepID=A0A835U5S9_VANPL|nr:hypothetical protein HPP92_026626 [Vanilla planifolia]